MYVINFIEVRVVLCNYTLIIECGYNLPSSTLFFELAPSIIITRGVFAVI